MKAIFIPGLWFDTRGPIADSLWDRNIGIASVLGSNLNDRIISVSKLLTENPDVKTVIAHSAGCKVLTHLINLGLLPPHINVVLLCPAPLLGIKFRIKDFTFKALLNPRYLFKMAFGKDLMLSDKDIMKLMSVSVEELAEMKKNLTADSGTFIRQIVLAQFSKPLKPGFIQKMLGHENVWVYTARLDDMIGSTGKKTADVYRGINISKYVGHMDPLTDIDLTLKLLREAGCEIL